MSDAFFSAAYVESARRQFRVSLCAVIALALGAMAFAVVTEAGSAPGAATVDEGGDFIGRFITPSEQ